MDTMIYEIGSVTMAQQGKAALHRAGLASYISRQYTENGRISYGCGHNLVLPGDPDTIVRILANAGVRVRGIRPTNP